MRGTLLAVATATAAAAAALAACTSFTSGATSSDAGVDDQGDGAAAGGDAAPPGCEIFGGPADGGVPANWQAHTAGTVTADLATQQAARPCQKVGVNGAGSQAYFSRIAPYPDVTFDVDLYVPTPTTTIASGSVALARVDCGGGQYVMLDLDNNGISIEVNPTGADGYETFGESYYDRWHTFTFDIRGTSVTVKSDGKSFAMSSAQSFSGMNCTFQVGVDDSDQTGTFESCVAQVCASKPF